MAEPVRATVLGLVLVGFILCLVGLVTPFWGMGLLTRLDKEKGVIERLVNNWQDPNFIRASVWNSHEWWPEVSATGQQLQGSGTLSEAKICAIFGIITGLAAVVVQAVYTFRAGMHFNKICCVFAACLQISAGLFSGVVCAIMAGCITNKMASNPLFRLGDSFIVTLIGTILLAVCGLFTLFHFVYSMRELALDKKILLLYPDVQPIDEPQFAAAAAAGGMPHSEQFPTNTSIVQHLQSPANEYPA